MSTANDAGRGEPAPASRHEEKILLVLTLVIGAVVGLIVVAFILLTENLGARLYPAGGAAWRRLLVPVLGALGTGFLLSRYFPNARGSGIPQTKVALFLRDGYISMRTVLGKFGLCSVSLATGIALGREGPSVQVGAGLASVLGRRLGLSRESVKALVPVGASAALAAAFNTPIAAVLFSLEEVMGNMHAPVLGSIVLSSATSWIVLHLVLGDEPLFHVPPYQLVHPIEFLVYAVLGVIGGLVSVAFVRLLLWQRNYFLGLPKSTEWIQPTVGGLTVGILGWFFPNVLGVGYAFVSQALNGQLVIGAMLLLVLLKVVATATCYASGNAGGIFGPSLFIGAMLGGAVGGAAHMLMPDYTGSVGAYALVGMGAAFAGIVRVPLTSVIMIFEITRDYSIIVPLMIANLVSYFISSRLQEEPIYEALQHQDGIHLPSAPHLQEAPLLVRDAYRPRAAQASPEHLDEGTPHVHPDHPADLAMRRLAETGLKELPVVGRANVHDVLGVVSVDDIVAAYGTLKHQEQTVAAEAASPKLPARLLGGLLATLLVVLLVAGFLNHYYRAERTARALRFFTSGNELMAAGRTEEAIEQYRRALSVSHRVEDRLALGQALVKAGHWSEAAIYLNEVLQQSPASSPANLGMARIEAHNGNTDRAALYYQRAIVGASPTGVPDDRFQTRIELAEFLDKAGRRAQAQAELLAAAAAVPNDPTVKKQVGQLLISHGLARNAADVFREVLEHDKQDAGAFDGLGEAEFAVGDYSAARAAFRRALAIAPADPVAGARAALCDRILDLDPTQPGLRGPARFQRSQELLQDVATALSNCGGADFALPTDVVAELQGARTALARQKRPESFGDAADANVALAGQLWTARLKICQTAPAADDPVSRVMSKLAHP